MGLTLIHEDPEQFPEFAETLGLRSPNFDLALIRSRDNPDKAYREADERFFAQKEG